jgi:hypothetical protein
MLKTLSFSVAVLLGLCSFTEAEDKILTVNVTRVQNMDLMRPEVRYNNRLTSSKIKIPSDCKNFRFFPSNHCIIPIVNISKSSLPIDINLQALNGGMAYLGPVYMGETQKANVVYDTGSSWLTVTSTECVSSC